jgi:hypothetical protein
VTSGPANLLHHRETDTPGSDYRGKRYVEEREVILKRDNSLQKWATTVFLAGVISVVGYLLARDRFGIDVQFGKVDQALGIIDSRVDRNSTDLELLKVQQAQVASDIKDIRAMIQEQSRLSVDNGKTLERLLALQRNRQ